VCEISCVETGQEEEGAFSDAREEETVEGLSTTESVSLSKEWSQVQYQPKLQPVTAGWTQSKHVYSCSYFVYFRPTFIICGM